MTWGRREGGWTLEGAKQAALHRQVRQTDNSRQAGMGGWWEGQNISAARVRTGRRRHRQQCLPPGAGAELAYP